MSWFSRRMSAARMRSDASAGFSLIEVIVALTLIIFVMSASVVFFVQSMQTSNAQQARQAAISLSNQGMEQARATAATALLSGRDQTRSDAQWATIPAAASAAAAVSSEVYDSTATTSSTPVVPFSTADVTTLVNKTQYTVNTFIGKCWVSTTTAAICNVPGSPPAGATPMYRIIVDVHWAAKRSESCPASGCDYVVSTLRDPSAEPLFNSNGP